MELRSLSKTSVRVVGRGMAIVAVRDQSKSVYCNDVLLSVSLFVRDSMIKSSVQACPLTSIGDQTPYAPHIVGSISSLYLPSVHFCILVFIRGNTLHSYCIISFLFLGPSRHSPCSYALPLFYVPATHCIFYLVLEPSNLQRGLSASPYVFLERKPACPAYSRPQASTLIYHYCLDHDSERQRNHSTINRRTWNLRYQATGTTVPSISDTLSCRGCISGSHRCR